jgi:membrane protease YdiL (CAAX protease family)
MINLVNPGNLQVLLSEELVALISYVLLYLLYYFGSEFAIIKKFRARYHETSDNFEQSVYLRRLLGFILLGIIPFFITLFYFTGPLTQYGLGFPSGNNALLWFLIPTILIVGGSIVRPKRMIDRSYYPEVRQKEWTKRHTIINAFFWTIYLLGYEFALRGMVFFTSVAAFGLYPAIIINSVIYSLIHIFKGRQEAFGAFFLGVLFCLITFYTNSIWIAFIIHAAMAIINDIKAVKAAKVTETQVDKVEHPKIM